MVPSGLAMTPSFVWNRILLLGLFRMKLIIGEVSLDFCKRGEQQFRFTTIHSASILEESLLVKICQFLNLVCYVTHIILTKKSHVYTQKNIGWRCPVLENTRVTLLKEKALQRTKNICITKRDRNSPRLNERILVRNSFAHTCGHAYQNHRYRLYVIC